MTEAELDLLRAKAATLAAQVLLRAACNQGRRLQPLFLQNLLRSASQWDETQIQSLTIQGLPPGYSDLLAGELQEALSALLKDMQAW